MIEYNKLVRDKIPEIIAQDGKKPIIHTASKSEYEEKLSEKLQEEVAEFLESHDPEELADILEVVYTLAGLSGVDKEALEELRKKKAEERGSFSQKIILEKVE